MLNPDNSTTYDNKTKVEQLELSSEISTEHSLPAQIRLMHYMIPSELKDLIEKSSGENISNEDELFFLWNEYFSSDFRNFWDNEPDLPENQERYERIMQETQDNESLTDEDLTTIVATFNLKDKELFVEKVREVLLREEELMV